MSAADTTPIDPHNERSVYLLLIVVVALFLLLLSSSKIYVDVKRDFRRVRRIARDRFGLSLGNDKEDD